jgi:hypothetical protein
VISANCSAGNDEASFPRELMGAFTGAVMGFLPRGLGGVAYVAATGWQVRTSHVENVLFMRLGAIDLRQKRNI